MPVPLLQPEGQQVVNFRVQADWGAGHGATMGTCPMSLTQVACNCSISVCAISSDIDFYCSHAVS